MGVKEVRGSVPFLQPQNRGLLSSDGALKGGHAKALLLSQLSESFFMLTELPSVPCKL
jgi:hypothetical protein